MEFLIKTPGIISSAKWYIIDPFILKPILSIFRNRRFPTFALIFRHRRSISLCHRSFVFHRLFLQVG